MKKETAKICERCKELVNTLTQCYSCGDYLCDDCFGRSQYKHECEECLTREWED